MRIPVILSQLQLPAEGLMQQRLFQFVEGCQFALVEGFEALGFDGKLIMPSSNTPLFRQGHFRHLPR